VVDAQTFKKTALEWHQKRANATHIAKGALWTPGHAARIWRGLEMNILPWIGSKPINTITPPALLEVIRRIEPEAPSRLHTETSLSVDRFSASASHVVIANATLQRIFAERLLQWCIRIMRPFLNLKR
jgi:hypothetical protein